MNLNSFKKILLIVFLGIVVGGTVLYLNFFQEKSLIYLSLLPNDKSRSFTIYSFNPKKPALVKFLPAEKDNRAGYFTGTFSPDGKTFATSRFVEDSSKKIILVNTKDGSTRPLYSTPLSYSQNPVWSPDGKKIVFMDTNTKGSVPDYRIKAWNVYVAEVGTEPQEVQKIGTGAYPLFTPEGNILALESDGVYLFDLDVKNNEKIAAEKILNIKNATLYNTIGISKDGRKFAWTDGRTKKLYVLNVQSWKPFKGEVVVTLSDVISFWPVFSPDSSRLAVQTNNFDPPSNIKLVIYNLSTAKKDLEFNLNAYKRRLPSVTDWR